MRGRVTAVYQTCVLLAPLQPERPVMTNNPNNRNTHIVILLDRSGSMESIAGDIVGGFNQFMRSWHGRAGHLRAVRHRRSARGDRCWRANRRNRAADKGLVESRVVALGWLYLYSRYRKAKHRLREDDDAAEAANELCDHCGHPRYKHADDEQQTCPIYLG